MIVVVGADSSCHIYIYRYIDLQWPTLAFKFQNALERFSKDIIYIYIHSHFYIGWLCWATFKARRHSAPSDIDSAWENAQFDGCSSPWQLTKRIYAIVKLWYDSMKADPSQTCSLKVHDCIYPLMSCMKWPLHIWSISFAVTICGCWWLQRSPQACGAVLHPVMSA